MSSNETVVFLRKVQLEMTTLAAMSVAYPNWDAAAARQRLNEIWHDIPSKERPAYNQRISIDGLRSASIEDLLSLGFMPLDDLMLIPLWVYNYIADGQTLVQVNGKQVQKRYGAQDMETKYGCIAFGFHFVPEPANDNVAEQIVPKKKGGYKPRSKQKELEAVKKFEQQTLATRAAEHAVESAALPEFLDPELAAVMAKGDTIVVPPPGPNDFVYKDE